MRYLSIQFMRSHLAAIVKLSISLIIKKMYPTIALLG